MYQVIKNPVFHSTSNCAFFSLIVSLYLQIISITVNGTARGIRSPRLVCGSRRCPHLLHHLYRATSTATGFAESRFSRRLPVLYRVKSRNIPIAMTTATKTHSVGACA